MSNGHISANTEALVFTGERFVPEIHGNIELEHLHRYLQASEIASGKVVLDIACGEGYGSAVLAKTAGKVIGIDLSTDAVRHAQKRYQKENLEFIAGNCAAIPLSAASVDLVVSFETIEHHEQHELMMQEVKRVLRPTGVLLISSPDKHHYSVETGYINPFHVKELYQHEFKLLLRTHFANVTFFGQRVIYGSCIFSESVPTPVSSHLRKDGILIESAGVIKPTYWIALASDVLLPQLASGILEQPINDTEIIQSWQKVLAEREAYIHQMVTSVSWNMTKPFRFVASIWRDFIN